MIEDLARTLTRRIDKEGRIMKRNWIRYHCAQKKKSSNENINRKSTWNPGAVYYGLISLR